ncbi:hypothetical protein SO802_032045 [Lithocarpus litseifolius]|uniref:Uncharacterized protein n=1 Tax=Lithocarpus litseifolius TaxID=425828 RepID=A0AAW2BQL5_9ROSI
MEIICSIPAIVSVFQNKFHNILLKNLTYESGELIGNSIGKVVQVANPGDDGSGGKFLGARVTMDISKPLLRCLKLRSKGKPIGLVGI